MTTNKPEVVAWYTPPTIDTLPVVALNGRSQRSEPLIRLSDYEAPQPTPDVTQLVEALEKGFPLLDDEGLDEVEHHCEYVIQRERKRVHSILAAYRNQGGDI